MNLELILQSQMRLLTGIKEAIFKFDLFASGSLLRVRGEPQHKTLQGGALSILMIVMLIAAFASKVMDTLNMVVITSSSSKSNTNDPLPFNISTVGTRPFMLAVEVLNHNLNEGSRYFDVELISANSRYGLIQNNSIYGLMQACTVNHWRGYPDIQAKFNQMNMPNWKCLPMDVNFEIKGKYSSEESKTLSISIKVCTNGTSDGRSCAPQSQIDQYFINSGQNLFSIYYINPIINPDGPDYLSYYLEDTSYISFSHDYGGDAMIFIEDYSISTDNSILPTTKIYTQTGGIVTNPPIKNFFIDVSLSYATFTFYKSSTSNIINRSFQKLDSVLSYIGGLFGTVTMCFFLVSSYNTYKFEVSLAGYLYRTQRNEQRIEKKYNFLYFLAQNVYSLLRMLNFHPKWTTVQQYHQKREEMLKQLDVLYLIKRINFLQRALSYLFREEQLKGLHLTCQYTMADAAKLRRSYKLKARLKKEVEKIEKSQIFEKKSFNTELANRNISFQIIDFENGEKPKSEQGDLQAFANNYSFDSDSYTSDESSHEQEDEQLVMNLSELQKDKKNEVSKRVWEDIDVRLKQIIQKSQLNHKFKKQVPPFWQEKPHVRNRRYTIDMNKLILNDYENMKSDQIVENTQAKNELAKEAFTKFQTLKIQAKYNLNINDKLIKEEQ